MHYFLCFYYIEKRKKRFWNLWWDKYWWSQMNFNFFSIFYFKNILFILFLERGEGREKERERNIKVCLPLMHPLLGPWPATWACALTGNQTSNTVGHRPAFSPLSHTSQGWIFIYHSSLGHTEYHPSSRRKKQKPTKDLRDTIVPVMYLSASFLIYNLDQIRYNSRNINYEYILLIPNKFLLFPCH